MIRKPFISLLAILSASLFSCEAPSGEVVVKENVHVFYTSPVNKAQAEQLADFWIEKKLNSNQKQYLQLSSVNNDFQLKMIANDTTYLNEIPFDVQIELAKLDSMLNTALFGDSRIDLFVSDKTFSKTKRIF